MNRLLVRGVVLPLLVAFVVLVGPLAFVIVRSEQSQLVELAERRVASAALFAAGGLTRAEVETLLAQLPLIEGERFWLLPPGRAPGADAPADLRPAREVIARALEGQVHGEFHRASRQALAGAPVFQQRRVAGIMVVALPAEGVDRRTRFLLAVLAGTAGLLLGAAALAGRSIANAVIRPVAELDRVAQRLAAGDLAARAAVTGPPELERLAGTLNASAERLDHLLEAQRRFVADASHQLRTPLTALKLRVENLLATGSDEARVEPVIRELDRLSRVVEQLLVLARVQGERPEPVDVDVARVASERVEALSQVAAAAGVTLVRTGAASAPARALAGAVEQVLDNLLGNALAAAPRGSEVEVDVQSGDEVVCVVLDRGPGMPAEDRARAFDRFWRGRGGRAPGTGLGLAIVAQLVDASDGTVELLARPGGGLAAQVRLRSASAVPPPPPG